MTLDERIAADKAILDLLGMELVDTSEAGLRMALEVRADMINAGGSCHGGIVFTLADTACAYALGQLSRFKPVTVDANISYLRPGVLGDRLVASAAVMKAGKRNGLCAVDISREDGTTIAVFRGTCANLFEE